MSETIQPPKDVSTLNRPPRRRRWRRYIGRRSAPDATGTPEDAPTKKRGRVLEFLSSLPGILTAIAATITAIGGLYVALRPHAKVEPADNKNVAAVGVPAPSPSSSSKEVRLKRHERAWVTERVEIELVDVENVEGKHGKGEGSTQDFNNNLDDRERIFSKILGEAGITNQTAQTIRAMTRAQWGKFLDSLSNHQREIIETTPFAKFNVYVDGHRNDNVRRSQFFEGEVLNLNDPRLQVVMLSISNTKRRQKSNVDLRIVK